MNLIILTPEKEIYNGRVKSVKVPGTTGQFEILTGHAPIVSSLTEGKIRVLDGDGNKTEFNIDSGFVEVIKNEISLLVRGLVEAAS